MHKHDGRSAATIIGLRTHGLFGVISGAHQDVTIVEFSEQFNVGFDFTQFQHASILTPLWGRINRCDKIEAAAFRDCKRHLIESKSLDMESLSTLILKPDNRPTLLSDCTALIESEVKSKSGLAGIGIKTAYKLVKAIKPGIIRASVDKLMDEFVGQADPFYASYIEDKATDFDSYLLGQRSELASALLGVTDRRIGGAKNTTIKKAYKKLRPAAQNHVEAAVPGLAKVLSKHVS